MASDEGSAPDGDAGTAGRAGPLPFDTSVAHQARIYNYVLGGKDNYAADRAAAEAWMQVYPQLAFDMRAADRLTSETKGALSDVAERMVRQQITYRNREQIARFFEGTDLVEPGIVAVEEWLPDPGAAAPGHSSVWCAVGRKEPRNRG